jgi:hypothetical protein
MRTMIMGIASAVLRACDEQGIECTCGKHMTEKREALIKKWIDRWGAEAAAEFDALVMNRSDLRKALKVMKNSGSQAHHLIPVECLKNSEVVQAAVIAGLEFNGKVNGWIEKEEFHLVAHKELNELIGERLEAWEQEHPGYTPAEARRFIEEDVLPEWRSNWLNA